MTSGKVLGAGAAVVAVALGLWWLSRPAPPTEEERIRMVLEGAARAASEKRPGDVVEALSESFRGEGLDRRGVKQLVALLTLRGEWVSVSISEARIVVLGAQALANVDAVLARAAGAGKGLADLLPTDAAAHRFRCRLALEDGEWRVVEAAWSPISLGDALAGPPEPEPGGAGAGAGGR